MFDSAVFKLRYAISASYGNDSLALIQWAYERGLRGGVAVAYCDTGWSSPGWPQRVTECERFARSLGYETVRCQSLGMPELVRQRKGFPGNAQQFCTAHLKGLPFLQWIDEVDPYGETIVMIGKRREESPKRAATREIIGEGSEYHAGRKVWHPLYAHTEADRNALLARAGFAPLPHRSDECYPCVNANRADFLRLTPGAVERVNDLEVEVGQPMFRAKRFGAMGVHGVIQWAKYGRDRGDIEAETTDCDSLFGCGL